jgi:hypothetical protein
MIEMGNELSEGTMRRKSMGKRKKIKERREGKERREELLILVSSDFFVISHYVDICASDQF